MKQKPVASRPVQKLGQNQPAQDSRPAMDDGDRSDPPSSMETAEDAAVPQGLSPAEYEQLRPTIDAHHLLPAAAASRRCASILAQRVRAPAAAVWSFVRRFDRPQAYKHFIKSCSLPAASDGGGGEETGEGGGRRIEVGCLREVSVISGLPASTSTERLDVLDDERRVFGFSIIGGEHRLRNYKSVTTVSEVAAEEPAPATVVVESYVVDVPEGNTEEDTRLFADTVVRLNLQKLAAVSEAMANSEKIKAV